MIVCNNSALNNDGWRRYSIWEHSATVHQLYRARARDEAVEMSCAAQAAELLAPLVTSGDTLLDAGCGSGYFFHSLRRRDIPAEYHGIDASPSLIAIGREELPRFGLAPERLSVLRIEDLDGAVNHAISRNVLPKTTINHLPPGGLLRLAGNFLILPEP